MPLITLDFETPYRDRVNAGTPGPKYTLKTMTYEEYIRDPLFIPMGLGVQEDDGPQDFYTDPHEMRRVLNFYFPPNNDNIMLAHNTMFDAAIMAWWFNVWAKTYWDTQGMSRALWPHHPAGLDPLTKRLFPNDPSKHKTKELVQFNGLWPEDMTPELYETYATYGKNDVRITFEAFKAMWPYFPNRELDSIDLAIKFFVRPGFILDKPMVQEYIERLEHNRDQAVAVAEVSATTLGSDPKFAAYLEKHHSIIVPKVPSPTEKNPDNTKWALAKGDLEFIQLQQEHSEIAPIWKARRLVKSTGELRRGERLLIHAHPETGRIAVPLSYYAAHTGRFGGTNKVNFQNFKRGSPLRRALCAPPGHMVVVRDLANIEGRVNAAFNGQWDKCDKFAAGVDLYNDIATEIFGYPVDRKAVHTDAQGRYLNKEGEVVEDIDDAEPLQFMEGFVGKTAELGLGYGMGALKFQTQCAILGGVLLPDETSKRTVQLWRGRNDQIVLGWKLGDRAIFDMASRNSAPYEWSCITVQRNRLTLPNGLALHYPDLQVQESDRGRQFEYHNGKFDKALWGGTLMENIIQALAGIIMKEMCLKIEEAIKEYGSWVVLTVHDEIVAIAPEQHAKTVNQIMQGIMAIPPDWAPNLPLSSSGGIAVNYSK